MKMLFSYFPVILPTEKFLVKLEFQFRLPLFRFTSSKGLLPFIPFLFILI